MMFFSKPIKKKSDMCFLNNEYLTGHNIERIVEYIKVNICQK
jgi:hypothetical protein